MFNITKKQPLFTLILAGIFSLFVVSPFYSSAAEIQNEKIFLYAKPAVVRLGVSISGVVRFPALSFAEAEDGSVDIVTTGEITESPITTGWTCSGFIINPSGYIITNAHCVDSSTETISEYVWEQFSFQLLAGLQGTLSENIDESQINDLHAQILNFISEEGVVDNLTYRFTVFDPNRAEGNVQEFIDTGLQAEVKKIGQPFPQYGMDIAVLKIQKENLITVELGNSRDIKTGSRVFVMGFPAVADLNESGYIEPSFTAGVVSAIKKSSQGDYNVIQIDASISGGNSGGPVFNEKGEVIGIATFGATETQGFNWILPIDLTQEFLREINVQNTSIVTGEHYQKGVDFFLAKRYSKAKKEFEMVLGLYPNQATAQLVTKSNEAIAKGEEKGVFFILDFFQMNPVAWFGLFGVVMVILGMIYILIRRKRKSVETQYTANSHPIAVPQQTKPQTTMPKQINPQLRSYVTQSRAQGKNDDDIRKALRQAGWSEDDIEETLRVV